MKNLQKTFLAAVCAGLLSAAPMFAADLSAPTFADFNVSPSTAASFQNSDLEALLKEATQLYRQKKYDEALANCLKAMELSPNDFRPHSLAGLIYAAQWKLKSASEAFARAIALKPDNKQLYLYKAKADLLRNEREIALATARKALEIDPNFAEAFQLVGDSMRYDEKLKDEAIAAYRSAIKANPRLLTVYESLGEMLDWDKKDTKGAEEIYRKAMELDPKQMAGRFQLGRMLVKQGRLKEARTLWEGRTTDVERTFPNFITVLEQAERLKRATDALAAKPDDPDALLEMGSAVMEGASWVVDGRQERALEYFRKALALRPNFAAAQFSICKAYVQLADTDKGKNKNVDEELEKLRKMDAKLAKEIEEYRKTYSGGIQVAPTTLNQ